MRELLEILIAIGLHGLGHLCAARCCGIRLRRITLSATGLRWLTDTGGFPSYGKEALVALGGPLGNVLGNAFLLLLLRLSPANEGPVASLIAGTLPISLFLALWNLMPIRGFDGGRLLGCLLLQHRCAFSPTTAERVLNLTSAACFFVLWLLAVYLLLRTGRAFSLFLFCVQLFWGMYAAGERGAC